MMKVTTALPPITTRQLSYTKGTRTFHACSSDVGLTAAVTHAMGGMPRTLQLESHETGRVVSFTMTGATKDREGDITQWTYWSPDVRVSLVLFND